MYGPRYEGDDQTIRTVDGPLEDDDILRSAILFMDKLDFPENNGVSYPDLEDPQGLVQLQIMRRSRVEVSGRIGGAHFRRVPFELFSELDRREPAVWTIWQGPGESLIPSNATAPDLAFKLQLQSALVVPHREVPFDDLLTFKEKHRRELLALRHHIERLCSRVALGGFDPRDKLVEVEELDLSIADYLASARQSNLRKVVLGLDVEASWTDIAQSVFQKAQTALAGGGLAALTLPHAAVAFGVGALASLTVKSAFGLKGRATSSPFRYLAHIEREFG